MKVNFVKTFIPVKDFVAVEKVGDKILVRFDAVKDADMDAYSCVEGSVSASEYNEQEVRREYEAWKQKWAEKALVLAKKAKIAEITAYDTSSSVNGFILNGILVSWSKNDPNSPNVEKRMGLRQNIADKVALGEENIAIWLKGMSFTMPCAQAEVLMRSIENYAYECFNVTASHKQAVSELTTIEEVEAYDYKSGYPKMLEMSV